MIPKEAIMDENNADLILANSKYDYKGKNMKKGVKFLPGALFWVVFFYFFTLFLKKFI